jgi:hypothetical protein
MNPVLREVLIALAVIPLAIAVATIFNNFYLGVTVLVYAYPLYLLVRLFVWSRKYFIRYIRNLKSGHKPFLNQTTVSIIAVIAIVVLAFLTYGAMCNKGPTPSW